MHSTGLQYFKRLSRTKKKKSNVFYHSKNLVGSRLNLTDVLCFLNVFINFVDILVDLSVIVFILVPMITSAIKNESPDDDFFLIYVKKKNGGFTPAGNVQSTKQIGFLLYLTNANFSFA